MGSDSFRQDVTRYGGQGARIDEDDRGRARAGACDSSEQAGACGVADERIRGSYDFGRGGGAEPASDQEHSGTVVDAVAGDAAVKFCEAVVGFSGTVSKQAKRVGARVQVVAELSDLGNQTDAEGGQGREPDGQRFMLSARS